jgi:hypothetical protein
MENQESYERYGDQADIDHSMQKINSLLYIPSRYIGLKPILDLVIMAFAPIRVFMITHQLNIANQTQTYTEIILVLDHIDGQTKDKMRTFGKLAFVEKENIFVSMLTEIDMESRLTFGHPYYCCHFQKRYQVYSCKRSKLIKMDNDQLAKLKLTAQSAFQTVIEQANELLTLADNFIQNERYDTAAFLLYQGVLVIYQSITTAFIGRFPRHYTAKQYQKVAFMCLPAVKSTPALKKLPLKLEEACSLQCQPKYQNTPLAIEALAGEAQLLMQISKMAFAAKISLFDSAPKH